MPAIQLRLGAFSAAIVLLAVTSSSALAQKKYDTGATGATKWNDPKDFPWTMGWQPNYQNESIIYARYILKEKPDAKIAVLYQNDDYGKDYLKGLKDGLGAKAASMIVAEESYETTEPSIDSHIVKLQSLGADVSFNVTTPKFAAQAIKKMNEIGWKPLHLLNNVSNSIGTF